MKVSKNFLVVFGLLDVFSFIRLFFSFKTDIVNGEDLTIIGIVKSVLIFSLIFSGVFSILKKKTGIFIYYGQFALRLLFMIMSLGFLLIFSVTSYIHYALIVIIFAFEFYRLIYSILLHKKKLV